MILKFGLQPTDQDKEEKKKKVSRIKILRKIPKSSIYDDDFNPEPKREKH